MNVYIYVKIGRSRIYECVYICENRQRHERIGNVTKIGNFESQERHKKIGNLTIIYIYMCRYMWKTATSRLYIYVYIHVKMGNFEKISNVAKLATSRKSATSRCKHIYIYMYTAAEVQQRHVPQHTSTRQWRAAA